MRTAHKLTWFTQSSVTLKYSKVRRPPIRAHITEHKRWRGVAYALGEPIIQSLQVLLSSDLNVGLSQCLDQVRKLSTQEFGGEKGHVGVRADDGDGFVTIPKLLEELAIHRRPEQHGMEDKEPNQSDKLNTLIGFCRLACK
jgi:hypothetical protein